MKKVFPAKILSALKKMNVAMLLMVCLLFAAVPALADIGGNNGMPIVSPGTSILNPMEEKAIAADNINSSGYDIVYVIDNSGSIAAHEDYLRERNQAFRNITNLAIGSDIRIGVVYFGDRVENSDVLSLTSVEDMNTLTSPNEGVGKVLAFLNKGRDKSNDDTNIGKGLKRAYSLFDNPSREQVIILFSDGKDDNAQKDPSEETRKQAAVLQQAGIPIYCVYLQNGSNDQEELQNIVNYYSDVDYSNERFAPTNDVSELAEKFTEGFYSMQNDMQYHQIRLDAYGLDTCYVPALGVSKVRIFLDGAEEGSVMIQPAEESECKYWSDGSASFWQYDDPTPGIWKIQVNPADQQDVFGVITYYTDFYVRGELNREADGKNYRLVLHFYNGDGEAIAIDPAMEVVGTITYHTTESKTLTMTIQDGLAISEMFEAGRFGDQEYTVDIRYQDYIRLHYSIGGATADMLSSAEIEEETTTVPVTPEVIEEKEREETAIDEGSASAEDEEGISLGLIVAVIIVILLLILFMLKRMSRRKSSPDVLSKEFAEYKRLSEELQTIYDICSSEMLQARKSGRMDANLQNRMKEELLRVNAEMVDSRKRVEVIRKNTGDVKTAIQSLREQCEGQRQSKRHLEDILEVIRGKRVYVAAPSSTPASGNSQAAGSVGAATVPVTAHVKSAVSEKAVSGNFDIRCDLLIRSISVLKGAVGTMSSMSLDSAARHNGYSLDMISLLGREGKLGSADNLGATGITVHGYQDPGSGRPGLLLTSKKNMKIEMENGSVQVSNEAVLLNGNTYKLTIQARRGNAILEVSVQ